MIFAELQPGQCFIRIETDGLTSRRQICLGKSLHPLHRDKMLVIWAVEIDTIEFYDIFLEFQAVDASTYTGKYVGDANEQTLQEILSKVWKAYK